jgi:Signal transduction histidine kinase
LARIETQNKLQEQRLRISRDLHDNIGSQLTFIISSIDTLKYGFSDASEALSGKLTSISEFTSHTIYELRDTIWAMNKNNITLEDLQARITNFIEKAKTAAQVTSFEFKVESANADTITLTSVTGMNMYRIIQEAVNNSLKYAIASHISVTISEEKDAFSMEIKDNGIGFDIKTVALGNGLSNMKKRAHDIKALLVIDSQIEAGTVIKVRLPKKKLE